jgi:hypothetical protein
MNIRWRIETEQASTSQVRYITHQTPVNGQIPEQSRGKTFQTKVLNFHL